MARDFMNHLLCYSSDEVCNFPSRILLPHFLC